MTETENVEIDLSPERLIEYIAKLNNAFSGSGYNQGEYASCLMAAAIFVLQNNGNEKEICLSLCNQMFDYMQPMHKAFIEALEESKNNI